MAVYKQAGKAMGVKDIMQDYSILKQAISVESVRSKIEAFVKVIIPIIGGTLNNLYKMILVPQSIQNGLVRWLDMTETYLAANMAKRSYALLSEKQLQVCKKIMTMSEMGDLLCEMLLLTSSSDKCIVGLFLHEGANVNCNYRIEASAELFVKIEVNEWMCVIEEEKHMRIVCEDNAYEIDLKESAIIKMKGGCGLEIHEN